ncbi:MAG TPA: two-component regulator propeller domain-containing protein, partial [Calditrichia bacterium]|nr:two-component regulator propeller domain-containing protein [Calditrichia bacterium]
MMRSYFLQLLLSFLLLCDPLSVVMAQPARLHFDHLSVADGLPHAYVNKIARDAHGFIWAATMAGLVRYDGNRFRNYGHLQGESGQIISDNVSALFIDNRERLWLGTSQGEVYRMDVATARPVYQAVSSYREIRRQARINTIFQDAAGNMWIGTDGEGLHFMSAGDSSWQVLNEESLPANTYSNGVTDILADRHGDVWMGTWEGVSRFARDEMIPTRYQPEPDPNFAEVNYIVDILYTTRGEFWFASDGGGVFRYRPSENRFQRYLHDPENPFSLFDDGDISLGESEDGKIWIGSWAALNLLDPETGKADHYQVTEMDPYSLSDGSITCILREPSGVTWFGTADGGLQILAPDKQNVEAFYRIPGDSRTLVSNLVTSLFCTRSGDILIGTTDGLQVLKNGQGELSVIHSPSLGFEELTPVSVKTIFQDKKDNLWIGTLGQGLMMFDPDFPANIRHFMPDPDDSASLSSPYLTSIAEDPSGRIWVASEDNGITLIDPANFRFSRLHSDPDNPENPSSTQLQSLLVDNKGRMWIGSSDFGLDLFDPRTGLFTAYRQKAPPPHHLPASLVYQIYQDSRGLIWLATDGGLLRFDEETGPEIYLTQSRGLPGNVVLSITEDKHGTLWLGGNKGVSRYFPLDERLDIYSTSDGFLSDVFLPRSVTRHPDGSIFWGGIKGVNKIHPERMGKKPLNAGVLITGVNLFGQPLYLTGGSGFPPPFAGNYRENSLSFEFVVPDFANRHQIRYRYMLEGLDEQWVECGSQTIATYPHIN